MQRSPRRGDAMATLKVKDVRAARRRGLLDGQAAAQAVRQAGGGRHWRTCPACGGRYLPPMGRPQDPWCCGCCALAWGESDHSRMMGRGARVVRLVDGAPGMILACRSATEALAEFAGRRERVVLGDVEVIASLAVEHFPRCRRERRDGGPNP